jgi:hypothetical protein
VKPVLTVKEVAELLGFSYNTVRNLFDREPGVIVLKREEKMHKRGYTNVRIPWHVYERVMRWLSVRSQ